MPSKRINVARRPDLKPRARKIDIYWEEEDETRKLVHMADAKWRSAKVDENDVDVVHSMAMEIAAHKTYIISNAEFTQGAKGKAEDYRIALWTLVPSGTLNIADMPTADREAMQAYLQAQIGANEPWTLTVVHKGSAESSRGRAESTATVVGQPGITTKVVNSDTPGFQTKGPPSDGGFFRKG